jgi:hypothetical protein
MRMQWICRLQIETQCHSPGKGSLVCEGVWRSGAEKEEVDVRLLVGSAPRLPRAFVGGDVRLLEADSDGGFTFTRTLYCRNRTSYTYCNHFHLLLDSRADLALSSEKFLYWRSKE